MEIHVPWSMAKSDTQEWYNPKTRRRGLRLVTVECRKFGGRDAFGGDRTEKKCLSVMQPAKPNQIPPMRQGPFEPLHCQKTPQSLPNPQQAPNNPRRPVKRNRAVLTAPPLADPLCRSITPGAAVSLSSFSTKRGIGASTRGPLDLLPHVA
ncbi:hypothetical protein CHU98_g6374 [Xylaria longipes]|nr:hypothetical protein CHU98_g6374 [Xylaria longipes]